MTNKTEMVSVPRELLECVAEKDLCNRTLGELMQWAREVLIRHDAAPAEDVRAVVDEPVFNDPLYNAESDARNAAAMLEEVLEWFDDGVGRSPEEYKLLKKIRDWLNPPNKQT